MSTNSSNSKDKPAASVGQDDGFGMKQESDVDVNLNNLWSILSGGVFGLYCVICYLFCQFSRETLFAWSGRLHNGLFGNMSFGQQLDKVVPALSYLCCCGGNLSLFNQISHDKLYHNVGGLLRKHYSPQTDLKNRALGEKDLEKLMAKTNEKRQFKCDETNQMNPLFINYVVQVSQERMEKMDKMENHNNGMKSNSRSKYIYSTDSYKYSKYSKNSNASNASNGGMKSLTIRDIETKFQLLETSAQELAQDRPPPYFGGKYVIDTYKFVNFIKSGLSWEKSTFDDYFDKNANLKNKLEDALLNETDTGIYDCMRIFLIVMIVIDFEENKKRGIHYGKFENSRDIAALLISKNQLYDLVTRIKNETLPRIGSQTPYAGRILMTYFAHRHCIKSSDLMSCLATICQSRLRNIIGVALHGCKQHEYASQDETFDATNKQELFAVLAAMMTYSTCGSFDRCNAQLLCCSILNSVVMLYFITNMENYKKMKDGTRWNQQMLAKVINETFNEMKKIFNKK